MHIFLGTESEILQFLEGLEENHCVEDAEFLVDGMGYLTALARTDLDGHLNYTDHNIVKKFFQTYTMRIQHFHETWNGSQASAERWLPAYTAYYNHHHSHQVLNNQPLIEALKQRGSIQQFLPLIYYKYYNNYTIFFSDCIYCRVLLLFHGLFVPSFIRILRQMFQNSTVE